MDLAIQKYGCAPHPKATEPQGRCVGTLLCVVLNSVLFNFSNAPVPISSVALLALLSLYSTPTVWMDCSKIPFFNLYVESIGQELSTAKSSCLMKQELSAVLSSQSQHS